MTHYDEIFDQALTEMEAGNSQKALPLWEQALELLECEPEASQDEANTIQLNLAICALELGDNPRANQLCEKLAPHLSPLDEMGQQALRIQFDIAFSNGDLGRARTISEVALSVLDESESESESEEELDIELDTLVSVARRRAELARVMDSPDDAEDGFAFVLEILEAEEQTTEHKLFRAQLLEDRAHNRWLGQATQLAEFDLEDAEKIYLEELGHQHKSTQHVQNLLSHIRAA